MRNSEGGGPRAGSRPAGMSFANDNLACLTARGEGRGFDVRVRGGGVVDAEESRHGCSGFAG